MYCKAAKQEGENLEQNSEIKKINSEFDVSQEICHESVIYKQTEKGALHLLFCRPKESGPPMEQTTGGRTAVVWVHGGGFTGGNPQIYLPHCRHMARRGMVGISVEYRLVSKEATLLDSLSDVADAVLYVRAHAEEWEIYPKHIAAVGDSAGGYLVTALATAARGLGLAAASCPDAIVNCNGVVDLTGAFRSYAMGRDRELSPLYQVHAPLPSILHLQGGLDQTVLPQLTKAFHEKCLEAGGCSQMILWPDARHAFIVPGYTATEEQIVRAIREIEAFLERLWPSSAEEQNTKEEAYGDLSFGEPAGRRSGKML